jgi:starch-binding outer membrane protein, SusD/RagB family
MKYSKILFSSALALSLVSCKKVIDVKETDLIAGDVALQTVNNNNQAVVGAYAAMNMEMSILWNAITSDEVKVGEFYNSATVHEWQYGPTDVPIRDNFTAINPLYRIIDRVNRVLQALPNAKPTAGASDEALRSRLKGEALFLRAFAHFELVRYYSGKWNPTALAMTYMETPSLANTTRITMQPYFQKINADLVEAKNLLQAGVPDVYRANKVAAAGLQARVALYMEDWQNAITFSTEYITALPLATQAAFPGIWTDANNSELAFKLRRTAAIGARTGSLFRATSASASAIGTVTWLPSDELWNSYDQANDVRFSSYFRVEPLLAAGGRPSRLIKKYEGTGGYGTPTENVTDVKIFRTAEMYLIRAEAKAETNDLPGATQDINTLRAARITGYVPVATFASKQAAIDEIMLERFKELAYEGHRFWDLRRKNLPVTRLASDAQNASSMTLPAGNFRFVLPIPQSEINANPTMQQNPGYQ